MVQFDHTLYGVDEVAVAWARLEDGGLIGDCRTYKGEVMPEAQGLHVNALLQSADRRHSSYLNYGIGLQSGTDDLIKKHCELSAALCKECGVVGLSHDSVQMVRARESLSEVIWQLGRRGLLSLAFDKWVRSACSGQPILQPIGVIEHRGLELEVRNRNKEVLFSGTLATFVDKFFAGMKAVAERLTQGSPLGHVDYPWLTVTFNYLTGAMEEYIADPGATRFRHAAGSASSYYINEEMLQTNFDHLNQVLAAIGSLPPDASMRFIPTFSSQLFALDASSLDCLEELVFLWLSYSQATWSPVGQAVRKLAFTTSPAEVCSDLMALLPEKLLSRLTGLLDEFNAISQNKLPIAHIVGRPIHPTYNKYGIAQQHLLGRDIMFPPSLKSLRWGEAELLVKVLAALKQQDLG